MSLRKRKKRLRDRMRYDLFLRHVDAHSHLTFKDWLTHPYFKRRRLEAGL